MGRQTVDWALQGPSCVVRALTAVSSSFKVSLPTTTMKIKQILMARVHCWYISTANIFRYAYIQIYSFGRVFSLSFENWYVNILWNVQLSSIYFYYGKENIIFKTHKLKTANWKRIPQDLSYLSFAQVSPVCGGLWSSCTYCLWQHSGHCFSLPCQSAINRTENNQCLSGIPQQAHPLCPQCIRAFGKSCMLKGFSNFSYISRASTTMFTECQFVMLSIICWIKTYA